MSKTNHHSPLAVAYAQALLDLATERQQAEAIGAEFNELRRVIDADPMFHAFLSDPAVRQAERTRVLDSALAGQLSPLLANFLLAVNGRGHLGALPEMAAAYTDLLDRQLGKVDVDVTTAKALDAQELEGVRQRVSDALKKQANVRQKGGRIDHRRAGAPGRGPDHRRQRQVATTGDASANDRRQITSNKSRVAPNNEQLEQSWPSMSQRSPVS